MNHLPPRERDLKPRQERGEQVAAAVSSRPTLPECASSGTQREKSSRGRGRDLPREPRMRGGKFQRVEREAVNPP